MAPLLPCHKVKWQDMCVCKIRPKIVLKMMVFVLEIQTTDNCISILEGILIHLKLI
jgi:hypothetical protein